MKKKVWSILGLFVLSATLLTACGDDESATETTTEMIEINEPAAITDEPEVTFADLQDNYRALCEAYDSVKSMYLDDSVQQDEEITELLQRTEYIIDEMSTLTEADFGNQRI